MFTVTMSGNTPLAIGYLSNGGSSALTQEHRLVCGERDELCELRHNAKRGYLVPPPPLPLSRSMSRLPSDVRGRWRGCQ